MEGDNGLPPTPPPSPASSSRWNPTKEQISQLEGLYREGVRTPTAEQIQHITGKLRKYGRIEGKNVFYWFQNHKARQRQKQKQESLGYFARYLRTRAGAPVLCSAPPPLALLPTLPACTATGVVRTPFCMPQYTGVGFHPPLQRVVLPGVAHMRSEGGSQMLENPFCRIPEGSDPYKLQHHDVISTRGDEGACKGDAALHETLQLFPLHPTDTLRDKMGSSVCTVSAESGSLDEGEGGEKHLPFDFFGSAGKSS